MCFKSPKGGTVPASPPRQPTYDFSNHAWQESNFDEKCGTKPNNSTNSTNNSTNPTPTPGNTTSVNKPDVKEDKLLGLNKATVYVAAGLLTGISIALLFAVLFCAGKNAGAAKPSSMIRNV
jgi:hypothetical protein